MPRNDDKHEQEHEVEPLVVHHWDETNGTKSTTTTTTTIKHMTTSQKSRLRYLLIVFSVATILLLYNGKSMMSANSGTTATGRSRSGTGSGTGTGTGSHKHKNAVRPKMTIGALAKLQEQFSKARGELDEQLKVYYGQYYRDIFYFSNGTNRGSFLFESGDPNSSLSKQRLQRKLTMKLLEASSYDVPSSTTSGNSNTTKLTNFIWMTGGHSVAAGHGNFLNESTTAVLQVALRNIFDSVSINFIAKNYAMGGTSSAPELALCAKEIYGTDYDLIVWDFGMLDGDALWKQALYDYRTHLTSYQNPIHITFHAGSSRKYNKRYDLVQLFEEMGVGILVSNDDIIDEAQKAIPDTFGLNDEEIDALPEYVQNFKCGNNFEAGDPYCQRDKYHVAECVDRLFMVSWHPGWKWNALMAYLASYYMIGTLSDTLQDLATKLLTLDAVTIYNQLQIEANQDYETFRNASIPAVIFEQFPPDGVDGFNSKHFIGGPNYCHTTKLPAEIRYSGTLTETTTKVGFTFTTYDTGIEIDELLSDTYVSNSTQMQLSYTDYFRNKCPIPINIDYKDYFYIGAGTGWQQLTLPNPTERNIYNNYNGHVPTLQGFVAFCTTICANGGCPRNVLQHDGFVEKGYVQIRINQVEVTDLFWMRNAEGDCDIARHKDGYQFPVDPMNNTIMIEIQVNVPDTEDPKSYVRISSWIIW